MLPKLVFAWFGLSSQVLVVFPGLAACRSMSCCICLSKSFLLRLTLVTWISFARKSWIVGLLAMMLAADGVLRYSSANSTPIGSLLLLLRCCAVSLLAFSLHLILSSLWGSHRRVGASVLIGLSLRFLSAVVLALFPLRLRMDSMPSSTIGGAYFLFQEFDCINIMQNQLKFQHHALLMECTCF